MITVHEISGLKQSVAQHKKQYTRLMNQLKSMTSYDADELIQTQHDQIFSEISCLDCANCCKTTPALLIHEDINRISKYLRITVKDFLHNYAVRDEDGDIVFKQTPCVFLGEDSRCSIYNVRPKACREYPHTHQKNQQKILNITEKNLDICPAVKRIFDALLSANF